MHEKLHHMKIICYTVAQNCVGSTWHNFEVTTEIIVNVLLWEQEKLVGSG